MDRDNEGNTRLMTNTLQQGQIEWDRLEIKGTIKRPGDFTPSLAIVMSTKNWDEEPDASFIRNMKETIGSSIAQTERELRDLESKERTGLGSEDLETRIWWKRYELDRLKATEHLCHQFEIIS